MPAAPNWAVPSRDPSRIRLSAVRLPRHTAGWAPEGEVWDRSQQAPVLCPSLPVCWVTPGQAQQPAQPSFLLCQSSALCAERSQIPAPSEAVGPPLTALVTLSEEASAVNGSPHHTARSAQVQRLLLPKALASRLGTKVRPRSGYLPAPP